MSNSSATQRMAVIPYDKYEKMSRVNTNNNNNKPSDVENKTSANEEKLLSLDGQMKEILEDSSLNDMEKLHKYSEVMAKYLDFKDKVTYDSEDKMLPRSTDETAGPYNKSEDVVLKSEVKNSESNSSTPVINDKLKKQKRGNFRENTSLANVVSNWISL